MIRIAIVECWKCMWCTEEHQCLPKNQSNKEYDLESVPKFMPCVFYSPGVASSDTPVSDTPVASSNSYIDLSDMEN